MLRTRPQLGEVAGDSAMARAGVLTATGIVARCRNLRRRRADALRFAAGAWLAIVLIAVAPGCASTKWVSLRSTPRNPLTDALGLVTKQGPKPTPRTVQLLRRYDLEKKQSDKEAVLAALNEINRREPNRENI